MATNEAEAETQVAVHEEPAPATEALETLVEEAFGEECQKCGLLCSLDNGAVQKGNGLQCNSCVNLYQLMYRHLGGLPPSLQALSAEAQVEFFRSAGKIVKTASKNSRWKLMKQQLSNSLVTYHTEQRRCRVNEERLPLTAWAARGFDVERVKSKGVKFDDEAGLLCKHIFSFNG
eukprot:Skav233726  [mRNA]  locus=scaffold2225:53325:53849:+ [translate_table: standard]